MRHGYSFFLIALLCSHAAAAQVQQACCRDQKISRFYGTLALAGTSLQDDNAVPTTGTQPSIEYSIGYRASGALGYRLSPYFRTELELSARKNTVSSTTLSSSSSQKEGELRQDSYGAAVNAYVDLHNSTLTTPYFGAGAGIFRIRNPIESADSYVSHVLGITTEATDNAEDIVFGYQLMAGVSREFKLGGNYPAEALLGYRFFKTQDGEDKSKLVPSVKLNLKHQTHEIEMGMRLNF